MPYAKSKQKTENNLIDLVDLTNEVVTPTIVEKKPKIKKTRNPLYKLIGKENSIYDKEQKRIEEELQENPLYEMLEMQNYFYEKDKKRKQKLEKDLEPKLPNSYQKHRQSVIRLSKYDYADKKERKVKFKETLDRTNLIYNPKNDNQGIDNFLIIISEQLCVPDFMADRAKFILAKTWNKYQNVAFNQIHFEIVALACLMYCGYDDLPAGTAIDFKGILKEMYPKHEIGYRFKKLMAAFEAICELQKNQIVQQTKKSTFKHKEDLEYSSYFNRIVCTSDCLVRLMNIC